MVVNIRLENVEMRRSFSKTGKHYIVGIEDL